MVPINFSLLNSILCWYNNIRSSSSSSSSGGGGGGGGGGVSVSLEHW